jgi:hypothetical protein
MYRYLVYIRPVAYTILRKCFHHESANTLLFAPISRFSKGSLWSTKTFSEELKRLSRTVPGIPCDIGVQLYRQLSIAITEKYLLLTDLTILQIQLAKMRLLHGKAVTGRCSGIPHTGSTALSRISYSQRFCEYMREFRLIGIGS